MLEGFERRTPASAGPAAQELGFSVVAEHVYERGNLVRVAISARLARCFGTLLCIRSVERSLPTRLLNSSPRRIDGNDCRSDITYNSRRRLCEDCPRFRFQF